MRSAGILMPIPALPSPYGIGTMGQAARDFIKFLKEAGQSYWQILPICPTSFGDSPYQSFSSYAGNPYLIDLDDLAEQGLLTQQEYQELDWGSDPASVDYGLIYQQRFPVLQLACRRLLEQNSPVFAQFCSSNESWLEDYALFMAIKGKFQGVSWFQWPDEYRLRKPEVLDQARKELSNQLAFWRGVQFLFYQQFGALKQAANASGISIIGDLPIYVAGDSVDVWANPEQFQLNENGLPTEVAGCPPDGFTADGQLWGNPLFDWDYMKEDGYTWWLNRLQFQFRIYDALRIDHFRGFDAYYAIPVENANARHGRWRPGPGLDFFLTVHRALGSQNIIAEDLGYLTPSVRQLLEDTGYPGMKVLEFAFDRRDGGDSSFLPHNYPKNCVVYTGTHDNDTILGWLEHASPEDRDYAKEYLRLNHDEGFHWGMMRGAWGSVANLAVMQMQDFLGLGSEARMNIPSTVGNNWKWRALPHSYDAALAETIYQEMYLYGRLPMEQ